jgi:thioesterase domain-containing protein
MAAEYIADIRRFQPHGPYLIGGYSGGGTAAFEMAHQLEAMGERVGTLVLLDSFCPAIPTRSKLERVRLHARRLVDQGPRYAFEKLQDRLMQNELFRVRRLFFQRLSKLFPYYFRNDTMLFSWIDAFARYEAKPWTGRAHLFRVALDDSIQWSGIKVEHDLGWTPMVAELVIAEVPGGHNSMCEEPYVRVLADGVRKCLDEAQARIEAELGAAPSPRERAS